MNTVIDKIRKSAKLGATTFLPHVEMPEKENASSKQRIIQDLTPNFDNFPEYFTVEYMLSLNEEQLLAYYKKYDPVYYENTFNLTEEEEKIKKELDNYIFSLTAEDYCRFISEEGITKEDRDTIKLLYSRSEFFREKFSNLQEEYQNLDFDSEKLLEHILEEEKSREESRLSGLKRVMEIKERLQNASGTSDSGKK